MMFLSRKKLTLITSLILVLASGCSKLDDSYTCCDPDSEKFEVSYGTSFGQCIGYCKSSITITEEKITLTKSGWEDTVKTVIQSKSIEPEKWDSLLTILNIDDLANCPEYIGCPDCADGGAEWLEVLTADLNHKVTFEYHNEPVELSAYVDFLRRISKEMNAIQE